mmetsp:Transcript_15649/g.18635  ORF Transcript_15649/g.18635 Transcript_15649/m.18635 type:complete len:157 (+) Transcript_15649:1303-1773(+)
MKVWALQAGLCFEKRATLNEYQSLFTGSLKVPLRVMSVDMLLRNLVERAKSWTERARKLLNSPIEVPSTTIVVEGQKLLYSVNNIPVDMPEEKQLVACLDDSATRYCLCKGFNDGGFMIGCDGCENWYHGRCVGLSQKVGEALTAWTCPQCLKKIK